MYSLSFADYALAFIPGVNRKLIAAFVLLVFYFFNLVGVDAAAKIQNLVVILMSLALALFAGFGVFKIAPGYFAQEGFMTGGVKGLFTAASILTFATGGASVIINLGAEAKNPTKDIPFVLITSTLIVAVLYGFMSIIAAGVLPIDQVANKPLTAVAKEILPTALYVFFVIGGAMFALISTLNAQLAWATKPIMQACVDGWYPTFLAKTNKKGVPYIILTIYLIIGLITIFSGFDIDTIANVTLVLNYVTYIFISMSILNLPKVIPNEWNKSKFKVSNTKLLIFGLLGSFVALLQLFLLAQQLTALLISLNVIVLVIFTMYAIYREKTGKVKDMEISYEAS